MATFTIAFFGGIALIILAVGMLIYLIAKADQIYQQTEIERTKFNNDVRIFNAKLCEKQSQEEQE